MGCTSSAVVGPTPTPFASLPAAEDFHEKYALGEKLGKGAFAQVHLARTRGQPEKSVVAVKIRNLHSAESRECLDKRVCISAYKEVCLWSRVGSNTHCVQMHEHFFDGHLCYMVMEKCSRGLIAHIKGLSMITEASFSDIFAQMLKGISHLHSINLVHRDIKPDNFLVGGADHQTVKLADFGLAVFVPEGGKATGVAGTAPFICPEMLQTGKADLKADIWSFGILAYLLMCGEFPYNCRDGKASSMKLAIARGRQVKCKRAWLSSSAQEFLAAMLERDFHVRPAASDALGMPFIQSTVKAQLDLSPILVAAGRTGAFDSADLDETSTVDGLLLNLRKGKLERQSKVLAKHRINAFIGASPLEIERSVEGFLLSSHSGKKCPAKSEWSESTACPNSSSTSGSSGKSSK